MSITLTPCAETARLRVTGNIEAQLTLPADPPFDLDGENFMHAYYLALSDGSLIKAVRHDDPDWEMIIEGAATIEIDPSGRTLTAHWGIEWITLASNCKANAVAQKAIRPLPLFYPKHSSSNAVA